MDESISRWYTVDLDALRIRARATSAVYDRDWLWLALVGFGWLWLALVGFGWLCLALAGSGWLWLALVGSGWLWLALVGSGWLGLAYSCARQRTTSYNRETDEAISRWYAGDALRTCFRAMSNCVRT
jgi:hypothetical protein